jgi:hypothetical protein
LWGEDLRVLLSESLLPVLSTGFVTATKVSAIIENSRSPKWLTVDSLIALAFIVYLLLPEFWVGWKPA